MFLAYSRRIVAKLQVLVQTVQCISTVTGHMYMCSMQIHRNVAKLVWTLLGEKRLLSRRLLAPAALREYTRRKLRFDGNITSLASIETERKAVGKKKSEVVRVSREGWTGVNCELTLKFGQIFSRKKYKSSSVFFNFFLRVTEYFSTVEKFAKHLWTKTCSKFISLQLTVCCSI